MFNTLISTNEEMKKCIDKQQNVAIWLFRKCEGTAKILSFTTENVKADNGFWYSRRHCKFYVF